MPLVISVHGLKSGRNPCKCDLHILHPNLLRSAAVMLVSAAVMGLLVPPLPPMAVVEPAPMVLVQPRNALLGTARSPAGFPPTTSLNAAVPLYGGLGAPKANRANPAAGGNAENNWWTPSYVLDTDCEGNKVTPTNKLSQECINKKKVAELKSRQDLNSLNGQYKVEKLERIKQSQLDKAAQKAAQDAEVKARQAKYANRR